MRAAPLGERRANPVRALDQTLVGDRLAARARRGSGDRIAGGGL